MEEKPKKIWPERREAWRRLLVITAVLFPLSWVCFAFCVDSWAVPMSTSEDARHIFQWMAILAAGIAVVFLGSLLPVLAPLRQFLNRLFNPRRLRRLAIVAVWVVTAVILFYVEENWRATRAWNRYRGELEAQGAQLDFAAFIPKEIPDEQNFAATPVVKSWFDLSDQNWVTNRGERFSKLWDDDFWKVMAQFPNTGEPANRHFMDLGTWGADFDALQKNNSDSIKKPDEGNPDRAVRSAAAPSVLTGLQPDAAVLAELKEASARPFSRYPIVYKVEEPYSILLPHLGNVSRACRRLELRACAELAAGHSDAALSDVKLILYLGDSLKDEPMLISALVRMAAVKLAIQPVWEGLAEHAWTDAQLQELEPLLARYNFVADLKWPMDAERAADISVGEMIRKKGFGVFIEILGPGQPTPFDKRVADIGGVVIPGGWLRREEMSCCRLFQLQIDGLFDASSPLLPTRLQANQDAMAKEMPSEWIVGALLNHRLVARALLPALNRVITRSAETQTAANQAAIACALERYRLANGNFPETLDALTPKFMAQLPKDVINGKPMKYRRTSDGQFVLYSVGWNQTDDGGIPGKNLFDEKQGDWVWAYRTK